MFHLIFFLLPKLILLIFLNEMNYVFPVKKKKKKVHIYVVLLFSFQFLLGSAVFLLFSITLIVSLIR